LKRANEEALEKYAGFWRRLAAWLIIGQAKRYGPSDPVYLLRVMPLGECGFDLALWLIAGLIVTWRFRP
jgi:hypothetical protein